MKIIDLNTKRKEAIFKELESMLTDLSAYDIKISLQIADLKILYEELFKLYQTKGIIYEFKFDILTYFNEIIASFLEEKKSNFSYNYLNDGISLCQSIMSPVEISHNDINKVLKKAKRKVQMRRIINGK